MADERPQRDGKPLRGGHRAYSYPEIVVAYKHIDRVRQALDNAVPPIGHTLVDSDPDLGLGLISIENDVAAAWALHEHDPDWAEKIGGTEEPTGPTEGDGPSTYLDSFLRGLRGYFAKTYAGWKPVVGKNRIVGPITTTPGTVWHGGGGPPEASRGVFDERTGDGETGVVVGVLDTSIWAHPWFGGAWTGPPDQLLSVDGTATASTPLNAVAGHATFVTGLVLHQAPGAVVRARGVLSDDGEAPSWDVAQAIVRLALTKPDVINLSLVCYTEDGEPPLALATALDRVSPETVVVAAAGNHGNPSMLELTADELRTLTADFVPSDEEKGHLETGVPLQELVLQRESRKPAWPAAFDRVVAVGSADRDGVPSNFTPTNVEWIDVLAPGDMATSTFPTGHFWLDAHHKSRGTHFENGYASWSGTSFAAAKVSGRIAARTVPGKVSAVQAWAEILDEMQRAPTNTRNPMPTKPYFLSDDPGS